MLASPEAPRLGRNAANAAPALKAFHDSRRWCFLKLNPGAEPLKALVEAFLDTWQLGAIDPERVKQQNGWIELLHAELGQAKPPAFFLY